MSEHHDPESELDAVESIYDAMEGDQPLEALRLARQLLTRGGGQGDPVVRFLAGVALLALDRPEEAVEDLQSATTQDPDDPEFRANLALALYRLCRFEEADVESRRALESDDKLPDAHYARGLVLERIGRTEEADRHFDRAASLDPDAFPALLRLSTSQFEQQVVAAGRHLPETFQKHLAETVVTVEELPDERILREETPPLDPELLGLFVGVPLSERTNFSQGGELPPRILLFKRNLERSFPDPEELCVQIARTLHHELGHYLGLDEDELDAIGLG